MRRLPAFGVVLATVLAVGALAGVAQAQELEDYLDEAADAEYSGRQIVVTYWGDESHAGIYDVSQADGLTLVGGTVARTMVGAGKIDGLNDGRDPQELSEWSNWRLADRYSLQPAADAQRLGRPVNVVTILDEGRIRMRVAFDAATGAPLLSEVFDGDGDLYRMSVMVEFSPIAPGFPDGMMGGDGEYEVVAPAAAATLPATAGGYWRADTYSGPDAAIHAFYTDGLFSFSVFEFDGRANAGPFEDSAELRVGKGDYRRISEPGSVLVFWRDGNATYLLIGELPPDHLRAVLRDLPEPSEQGLLGRIWRGVFG